MHLGKVYCGLLLALIGNITSVSASEPTFNSVDAGRQRAFIKAMEEAARAAKQSDRPAAQAALRRAVLAGGYSLPSTFSDAACGHMAFEMPAWVLWAQATIGDIEGARQTAAYAGNAYSSMEALHQISDVQYGQKWGNVRAGNRPYIFREGTPLSRQQPRPRQHDYSVLKRLALPINPNAARQTLRLALPYAEAVARLEAKQNQQYTMYDALSTGGGSLILLIGWQAKIGDSEGARQTIARIRKASDRAIGLFQLAAWEQRSHSPQAASTLNQAEDILQSLPESLLQANVLYNVGRIALENRDSQVRQYLRRAADSAQIIPDLRIRYDALHSIYVAMELEESPVEGPVFQQTPEDQAFRKSLLLTMRDIVLKMPADPPKLYTVSALKLNSAIMNNPPRVMRLTSLASDLSFDFKDKAESKRTLDLAEQLALKEPNTSLRDHYLNIVTSNRD